MLKTVKTLWNLLRAITGDNAYEKYLEHWRTHHAHEGGEPLSRKAFFDAELQRRWSGVKRCC
ncbi:YbdD/YjiX family protein [Methylocaldum sp.]|uniref:YbdD/YjiX family protein n=1 Tax=Methylocaldum sp. TaxID=1969727 RepID=UPI002D3E4599|nr:YbdD/YjiX family protein [Methylocaldum sp.]HYE36885.1 YbdD/YjiX family protein [Methylocaldum sp.]